MYSRDDEKNRILTVKGKSFQTLNSCKRQRRSLAWFAVNFQYNRAVLPKTAFPRILFIDREIASGKYPSSGYLAEKYETSLSSVLFYSNDTMKVKLNPYAIRI